MLFSLFCLNRNGSYIIYFNVIHQFYNANIT
nr:MAG TPA: hypothetical protein [Caudoviricetes sp.]